MEVEMVTGLISTVGFPIFVAVYMLLKGSKDSQALKDAVQELTTAIHILNKKGE